MPDQATIAESSCGACHMQASLMRKPLHWSKLSPVEGSIFNRTEADMVFNVEHLGESFRVSPT